MRTPFSEIAAALLLIAASPASLAAQDSSFIDPYENYDESAALDMEIEENLATPLVQPRESPAIKRYMGALAKQLKGRYSKVETLRNGEVVLLTIPSDDLFLPCDTVLTFEGQRLLKPLMALFHDPDMFKLVYAVHTDDTGSDEYLDNLSMARSRSIYTWIVDVVKIDPDQFVINYDMADSRPLSTELSRAARASNRRLEIFFVPGPKLITLAHRKKLK